MIIIDPSFSKDDFDEIWDSHTVVEADDDASVCISAVFDEGGKAESDLHEQHLDRPISHSKSCEMTEKIEEDAKQDRDNGGDHLNEARNDALSTTAVNDAQLSSPLMQPGSESDKEPGANDNGDALYSIRSKAVEPYHEEERAKGRTKGRSLEHIIPAPFVEKATDTNDQIHLQVQTGKTNTDGRVALAQDLFHTHHGWGSQMEVISFSYDDDDAGDGLTLVLEDIDYHLDDMNTLAGCSTSGWSITKGTFEDSFKLSGRRNTSINDKNVIRSQRRKSVSPSRRTKKTTRMFHGSRSHTDTAFQLSYDSDDALDGLTVLFDDIDHDLDDMNTLVGSSTLGSSTYGYSLDFSRNRHNNSNVVVEDKLTRWLKERDQNRQKDIITVSWDLELGDQQLPDRSKSDMATRERLGQKGLAQRDTSENAAVGHTNISKRRYQACHNLYSTFLDSSLAMKLVLVVSVLLMIGSFSFLGSLYVTYAAKVDRDT